MRLRKRGKEASSFTFLSHGGIQKVLSDPPFQTLNIPALTLLNQRPEAPFLLALVGARSADPAVWSHLWPLAFLHLPSKSAPVPLRPEGTRSSSRPCHCLRPASARMETSHRRGVPQASLLTPPATAPVPPRANLRPVRPPCQPPPNHRLSSDVRGQRRRSKKKTPSRRARHCCWWETPLRGPRGWAGGPPGRAERRHHTSLTTDSPPWTNSPGRPSNRHRQPTSPPGTKWNTDPGALPRHYTAPARSSSGRTRCCQCACSVRQRSALEVSPAGFERSCRIWPARACVSTAAGSPRSREKPRLLGLKQDGPEVALLDILPSTLAETRAPEERFRAWPGLEAIEWRPGLRTGD